jgi:hypothetical protein
VQPGAALNPDAGRSGAGPSAAAVRLPNPRTELGATRATPGGDRSDRRLVGAPLSDGALAELGSALDALARCEAARSVRHPALARAARWTRARPAAAAAVCGVCALVALLLVMAVLGSVL